MKSAVMRRLLDFLSSTFIGIAQIIPHPASLEFGDPIQAHVLVTPIAAVAAEPEPAEPPVPAHERRPARLAHGNTESLDHRHC
jgi:hypothetical protein